MQNISHCTETLSLIPLATFTHSIGLGIGLVLSVAQCEYTIRLQPDAEILILHTETSVDLTGR